MSSEGMTLDGLVVCRSIYPLSRQGSTQARRERPHWAHEHRRAARTKSGHLEPRPSCKACGHHPMGQCQVQDRYTVDDGWGFICLTFQNRCVIVAVLGLFGGALANWMVYRFAYFNPRPISPWGPRPEDAGPRTFWDRLPVIGWCLLSHESK